MSKIFKGLLRCTNRYKGQIITKTPTIYRQPALKIISDGAWSTRKSFYNFANIVISQTTQPQTNYGIIINWFETRPVFVEPFLKKRVINKISKQSKNCINPSVSTGDK